MVCKINKMKWFGSFILSETVFLRLLFMHSLLFLLFSNYDQKLNEMQYLKRSCIQTYGKFANHNLER